MYLFISSGTEALSDVPETRFMMKTAFFFMLRMEYGFIAAAVLQAASMRELIVLCPVYTLQGNKRKVTKLTLKHLSYAFLFNIH